MCLIVLNENAHHVKNVWYGGVASVNQFGMLPVVRTVCLNVIYFSNCIDDLMVLMIQ